MSARDLCSLQQCRIVHFMFHDRVSFGGVLIAIATLYLWLAGFPMRDGEPWAWWTLAISGAIGFASFLGYMCYGYFDTWHGAATIVLLPAFVAGLVVTWRRLPRGSRSIGVLRRPAVPVAFAEAHDWGRACLLATAGGLVAAGLTISTIGVTSVFVDTDLSFIGLSAAQLREINPRLVPLIAHDRAGFGGGLVSVGTLIFDCVWRGTPSRALWQALAVAGTIGFACAIGVHPLIGYTNPIHLAPAVIGAIVYAAGLLLTAPRMLRMGPQRGHPKPHVDTSVSMV
jgi:hypothetical protein